ncbi:MAG TPA: hypothetical protein VN937_25020 [Blastocatellia bacterium]|nr:hypothetical protein [Blastocatellia bacterium]
MITLPKVIQEAVRTSEDQRIRLTDPETNKEYVLLPLSFMIKHASWFTSNQLCHRRRNSL